MVKKVPFRLRSGCKHVTPIETAVMVMTGLGGQVTELGVDEVKRRFNLGFESIVSIAVDAYEWDKRRRSRSIPRKVWDFLSEPVVNWYGEHTNEWVYPAEPMNLKEERPVRPAATTVEELGDGPWQCSITPVADELREARLPEGLSQEQVAQWVEGTLQVPELSAAWWAKIKGGARPIPVGKLLSVAKFFFPGCFGSTASGVLTKNYEFLADRLEYTLRTGGEPRVQVCGIDFGRAKKLYALPADIRAAVYELANWVPSLESSERR